MRRPDPPPPFPTRSERSRRADELVAELVPKRAAFSPAAAAGLTPVSAVAEPPLETDFELSSRPPVATVTTAPAPITATTPIITIVPHRILMVRPSIDDS